MESKHKEILQRTIQLFMQYGIKSHTMDDIAAKLGMSKKTIYQFIKNKEDLVFQALSMFIEIQKQKFETILKKPLNAIDQFISINQEIGQHLKQTHPSVMFDVQKYYPEAWDLVRNFKNEFIAQLIKENLSKGISEGLYRNNINPEIVAFLYVSMADNLFNINHLSMKYSIVQLHRELVRYHIRAVANEKGILHLQKTFNKTD
ncbi:MAG: TetR/AcrR family transcriptional regulator [Vicingaceae bacterium]